MSKSKPISNPSNDAQPPRDQPPWFVYMLCCGDGSFYTGITKDIDRRLKQHNAGKASRYTRSRLPVEIIYREVQPDQSAALKRELAIKALSRPAKQNLIKSDSNRLGDAKSAG